MSNRVRLLPVLMMAAVMLFSLKAISLWTGVNTFVAGIGAAVAEEPQRTHTQIAEKSTVHDETDHAPDAEHGGGNDHGEQNSNAKHNEDHKADANPEIVSAQSARRVDERDSSFYSRSEIEVLQQLGDRRSKLEAREREIAMREQLLVAAEKRVESKVAELKEIEANIQSLLIQKEGEDETKIVSLVKVYENMKAKDAARIFDKLEMDVLLPVAQRMKEQKFAAVLAKMDSGAAQQLTVELAEVHEYDASLN